MFRAPSSCITSDQFLHPQLSPLPIASIHSVSFFSISSMSLSRGHARQARQTSKRYVQNECHLGQSPTYLLFGGHATPLPVPAWRPTKGNGAHYPRRRSFCTQWFSVRFGALGNHWLAVFATDTKRNGPSVKLGRPAQLGLNWVLLFGLLSSFKELVNKWRITYQLKLGDVPFPPQIGTHLGTNRRQTIISIHDHVDEAIACRTKVSWKRSNGHLSKKETAKV